jgi:hypothetical protein
MRTIGHAPFAVRSLVCPETSRCAGTVAGDASERGSKAGTALQGQHPHSRVIEPIDRRNASTLGAGAAA